MVVFQNNKKKMVWQVAFLITPELENEMAKNSELGDSLSINICLLYPYYSVRYLSTTNLWTVVCLKTFFLYIKKWYSNRNDQREIIRQLFLEHVKI